MFQTHPEPAAWLSLWRRDETKDWSQPKVRARRERSTPVLEINYREQWVQIQRGSIARRRSSSQPPDWFQVENPPLLSASVYSLPARVMKQGQLTRARCAEVLSHASQHFLPKSLTRRDWKLELVFESTEKRLIVRQSECPVQTWELVREQSVDLADPESRLQ